jgi:poly-gamma-glutamate synthesis protein (capsule biosynthesis protein)
MLAIPSTNGDPGETSLCPVLRPSSGTGPRILFTGDFCPGPDQPTEATWAARGADSREPFLLSLTGSVDFSIANLECPLGTGAGAAKSGPRLSADAAWASTLAASGIDAVSLANNHAMDQGASGLESTLAATAAAGILHVGAGHDLEHASRPLMVPLDGQAVAVLSYAEHEFGIAGPVRPGVCPLVPETALRDIRAARETSDRVVVLIHGGAEQYPLPRPGLRDACRFLVDCGADAVLCCHPHVVGPVEWYSGAPIVYGLGNLYFPWHAATHPEGWHDGMVAVLEFGPRIGLQLVPTRFSEDRQGIEGVSAAETAGLATRLEALSATVVDDEALGVAWAGFVKAHRRDYLSALLGLTRVERLALRSGIWPSWRIRRKDLPALLNVVRCESHREALLSALEDETRA